MMTDGVGQLDYPLERLQERPAEDAAAVFTTRRVVSEGLEIVRFAERAGQGVWLGGEGVCHLLFLSDLFGFLSDLSTEQMHRAWLKNTDPCDSFSARAQSRLSANGRSISIVSSCSPISSVLTGSSNVLHEGGYDIAQIVDS
jgi:hypothetical protein